MLQAAHMYCPLSLLSQDAKHCKHAVGRLRQGCNHEVRNVSWHPMKASLQCPRTQKIDCTACQTSTMLQTQHAVEILSQHLFLMSERSSNGGIAPSLTTDFTLCTVFPCSTKGSLTSLHSFNHGMLNGVIMLYYL